MSFIFQDNALLISSLGWDVRISWYPSPLAEEKRKEGVWREACPSFRLLRPAVTGSAREIQLGPADLLVPPVDNALIEARDKAFAAFRACVDPGLVTIVERFESDQWAMLRLMKRHEPFRELAESNPVLAYCVANGHEFRNSWPDVAARLAVWHSYQRQRDLAGYLRFPAREAVVSTLKRVQPEAATPSSMRMLRSAIGARESVLKLLGQMKVINSGVLGLVISRHIARFLTPSLLDEVSKCTAETFCATTAGLLLDVVRMHSDMKARTVPVAVHSIARARDLHELTILEYNAHTERAEREERRVVRRRDRAVAPARAGVALLDVAAIAEPVGLPRGPRKRIVFPKPPIAGTATIVPLQTNADLKLEGRTQSNCVGSYARSVVSGRLYIYKVLEPQRSTLSIVMNRSGNWVIEQLKGCANTVVSEATRRHVNHWLASSQRQSGS